MLKIAVHIILFFNIFVLGYFLILNLFYVFLFFTAARQLFYYKTRKKIRICKGADCAINPSISLIVTAYNEEIIIKDSIESLLKLDYGSYEIVVVNDGSDDNTMKVLKPLLCLHEMWHWEQMVPFILPIAKIIELSK